MFDLRAGGRLRFEVAGYADAPRETLADLALSTRGFVAWVMRHPEFGQAIYVRAGKQYARLDRGPAEPLRIVSIEGLIVRWSHAGELRTATLNPSAVR